MKLGIWIVAGIVLVAIVGTYYASKHYTIGSIASTTGLPSTTLLAAANSSTVAPAAVK